MTVGCLTLILLLIILAYVGNAVGQVYWRTYRFQDAMTQQAKFAAGVADDTIIARLRAQADSLGLPPEAQRIHVRRTAKGINIWSQYADSVFLPGMNREVDFTVHAENSF
ncbi:MAG TPA: hypothetical protein VFU90_02155 [Candidatus Tumulicola sp.]|nr:hypothetical protein [Candidatus Tumulicola sp.]